MNTAEDTPDLTQVPFYQWDSIPYDLEVEAPEVGVATDSTFGVYMLRDTTAVRESVERPSLFAGHELPVNQPLAERAATAPQAWVFVVLVALMAVTTLYYRQSKIRFGEMLRSLFDSRAMDRMMRNNNLTRSSQLAPMGLLLAVTAALPVHQLALARTGFVGYLLLAVGLVLAYYLRNGVIRLPSSTTPPPRAPTLPATTSTIWFWPWLCYLCFCRYYTCPSGAKRSLTSWQSWLSSRL